VETPKTRYVTTVDGVRIAYWTMGEGEPFVYLSGWPFEHIELELQRAVDIELYGHLSQHRMLVRYDGRGAGMSDREVEDVSLTARVLDLAAVVGQLETRPIALVGFATSAPVAIVFAARHPELVSRLVLYDAHADLKSLSERPQIKAVTGLMSANYEMFTETLGSLGYGYSSDQARAYAAFVRGCTSKETAIRAIGEMANIDVTHLLPALTMPVMVLQHRQVPYDGEGTATALAEAIPGAELVFLEGSYGTNPAGERGPIAEFLGAPPLDPTHLRTVTIMFTDIVDSTVTIQRLGDEKAQELVRAHNGIVRDALRANYGNEVKHTGDGIMASFLSAPRALDAAIQIQRAVEQYNATAETALELRLGVNAGQPVMEEDDFFGSAVNMAARVCRASEAGQILVTDYVRELASDASFTFVDKGPATLRGFEEPIPLFAVQWRT
jgi:class 3 adenylate cyclase/pimeloyl-ACP methyl ester carboxylesterase